MTAPKTRCSWPGTKDPVYIAYHDEEWGVPEYDDRALFEKLILDGFQAGLSWITILRKRDNFRKAFADFEPEKIARFTDKRMEKLMQDTGIVRNRAKIIATVGNAKAYLDIMENSEGFSNYLWDFVDGAPVVNKVKNYRDHMVKSLQSEAMAKELKRRGFKFCGPVIVYAFMQAVGMVNDHLVTCHRHEPVAAIPPRPGY